MTAQQKTEWDQLFIGGKWTAPSTQEVIEVHSPATGEYVGRVPMAAAADVDAAVAAADAGLAAVGPGQRPAQPQRRTQHVAHRVG